MPLCVGAWGRGMVFYRLFYGEEITHQTKPKSRGKVLSMILSIDLVLILGVIIIVPMKKILFVFIHEYNLMVQITLIQLSSKF